MIGVVVPAHDEEAELDACLDALDRAARHPDLAGEAVRIVVVLDSCKDGSAAIVARHREVEALPVAVRNVGAARARGCTHVLDAGARWLAITDADSRVAPDWLVAQLALDADAVVGCVAIEDWSRHGHDVRRRYDAHYAFRDGHRHIHGANLGVSAAAYRRAGGFGALASGEDVALVGALEASGARIAWSARPGVVTSARVQGRARGGFADFLLSLRALPLGSPG